MLNKVILIGFLGNDPEIKNLNGGGKMASFSLATSEKWKDKDTGERKERTEWHRVTTMSEGLIAIIRQYLKKGSKCYIEAQVKYRKWTDDSGAEKQITEMQITSKGKLVLLDSQRHDSTPPPDEVYENEQ